MSIFEKLLVLGVLILVGVILAISLFWSRPDFNEGLPSSSFGQLPDRSANELPNQSTLTSDRPALAANAGGGLDLSGPRVAEPVNTAPYPFLQPSLSPLFWSYRVRQGDTPATVSERVTGTRNYARIIWKSNDERAFVPGVEILIPREIVKAPNEIQTGVADRAEPGPVSLSGDVATGPPAVAAAGPAATAAPESAAPSGAKPAASTAKPAGAKVYVVKPGENLRQIAREQLKSEKRWIEIKSVNHLKNDTIRAGQKLILP